MLAPWKKSYDKPRQHIKRQRYHFADKGLSSQGYGFSAVIYRCENGTIMKARCQRIDAFRLWCLRRLLRIPWTAKRSNQSILKEINPECSLEELMLKRQYFSHLMRRANSLEKILMLGKIDGRRRGRQRIRESDNSTISKNMNFSKLGETVEKRETWGLKESDTTERPQTTSTTSLSSNDCPSPTK